MADAALDLVQRLYRRYSEGAVDDLFAALHPDFVFISCGPGEALDTAGTWEGAEGLRAYLERLGARWVIEEHVPLEFVQQGERIVVRTRVCARSRATGRCATMEKADFWTIVDGRVRSYQEIFDTAAILAAGAAGPG